MKKVLYTVAALSLVASVFAESKVEMLPLDNSKVHFYQSGDAMGDNSLIIETDKNLVLLEPLPFFADMEGINAYTKSLNKPISAVIANYHPFGMSNYKGVDVLMPEAMMGMIKSDFFAGLTAKFKESFGVENMDFTTPEKPKAISTKEALVIDGVEIEFSNGAASDFPAFSVLVDKGVYYSHFSPAQKHFNTLQIRNRDAIDAVLADLENIKASNAKYIVSSHGGIATMADVDFQIEYLKNLKDFLSKAKESGELGQMLLAAYPHLAGYENIRELTQALYPEEKLCQAKEELRAAMNKYFKSVASCDANLIKDVWADEEASLINGRGHFISEDGVANFMTKAFANDKDIKLYSSSEHITLLGEDGGLVRLYWVWNDTAADGTINVGRGRESLIFKKFNGEWKLVHVHYSPLPQVKK